MKIKDETLKRIDVLFDLQKELVDKFNEEYDKFIEGIKNIINPCPICGRLPSTSKHVFFCGDDPHSTCSPYRHSLKVFGKTTIETLERWNALGNRTDSDLLKAAVEKAKGISEIDS